MDRIIFTGRSLEQICEELDRHPSSETGGILLGWKRGISWEVRTVCLPHPVAIRETARFRFDAAWFNKEIERIRQMDPRPMVMLGLWHSHNHAMMPPFSVEDVAANQAFAGCNTFGAVSVLVQRRECGCDIIAYTIDRTGHQKRARLAQAQEDRCAVRIRLCQP